MKTRRSLTSILVILIILLLSGIHFFSSFPGMTAMNDEIDTDTSGGYSYAFRQGSEGNPGGAGLFQSLLTGLGDFIRKCGNTDLSKSGTFSPDNPKSSDTKTFEPLFETETAPATFGETRESDGDSIPVPEYPSLSMAFLLTAVVTAITCHLVQHQK